MFEYCQILPFIDVDGFDVSRVTNAECMFSSCFKLETIICDNTWSIDGNTHWMFYDSEMLKGATAYNSEKTDCAMANPTVGYFSPTPNIELKDGEDNSTLLAKYKGKRVNVTYDRVLSAVELDYDFYEPCAYTVCLPYDLDLSEQHNADLLQVCQLNYIQGGKYMIFSNADPVLKAGTPYLILMNEGEQRLDAKGVIITDEVAEGVPVLAYGEEYQELGTWKGTLHRIEGAAAAEMFAYSLQNDGYFKRIRPNTPQITCPAFRAYYSANEFTGREVYMPKFKLTIAGEDEDDDPILELPAAAFSPDSSIPDEAVGIIQVVTKNGDNEFFDLQGRKLQNRPVRKGLYIENGKKVMVK